MTWSPTPTPRRPPHIQGWSVTPPAKRPWHHRGWIAKPEGFTSAAAVVPLQGTASTAISVTAAASCDAQAEATAATPHVGDAPLSGEGTVIASAVPVTAAVSVGIDGTGEDAILFDSGFPYTFPITFGGVPPIREYPMALATVYAEATAVAAVGAAAPAESDILGLPEPPGFPYKFPITLS